VLAWIFRRCDEDARARATPIGLIPAPADLDLRGLELAPGALDELLAFDRGAVRDELTQIREYLAQFGERVPPEFRAELTRLAHEVTASVRDNQDNRAGRRFLGADSTR